ncbi:MAG: fumarate hydratase C-terminal domain-containing protein [Candidatus Gracilibacteria bacterium]|jgi:fumarate hydratase subunit beta|nr:fumarate hydratase C-terminal domain-containing protein [Candidatus Gracilibacteria bacterium]
MHKINNQKKAYNFINAGDLCSFSGKLILIRDQSLERLKNEKKPPISFENAVVFFCGPTPTPKSKITGSIGPTTTERMQDYFEMLFKLGAISLIGKGGIKDKYINIFKDKGCLMSVTGGVGAFLSKKVISSKILAYEDLLAEAIREMEVDDLPCVCVVDKNGKKII